MGTTLRVRPFALGLAFAVTTAFIYTVCGLAWGAWQESALDFLNALFHGLDFRRLQITGSRFSFGTFVYPLLVMSALGFVTGTLLGAICNRVRVQGQ
jgi:2TM family of unknown function (DUF5676)